MGKEFEYDPPAKFDLAINPETKTKYFVYNVSKDQANYSQMMSKYTYENGIYKSNGYSFCNTHIIGMGLIYLGYEQHYKSLIEATYPELKRLPDKIAKHCFESPKVLDYYKRNYPYLYTDFISGKKLNKDVVGPNELHNVLSYATNDFFNINTVTYFSTAVSWVDIISEIVFYGRPVGISGKFTGLNHMVLGVGVAYKTLDDQTKPGYIQIPDFIIVDDPFGKTYEYNKGLSGNDVWIPFENCVKDFKNLTDTKFKYAHRFIKPADIGR